MTRVALAAIVSLAAAVGMTRPSGTRPARGSAALIDRVAWLAGCWELRAGARVIHERWMAPLGGTMMGMSRTVVRDTTREWEQLRIESRGDRIVYLALPSGQAMAEFTGEVVTDTLVVFANPAHDFPQRILYRVAGADSVVARIEGTRNGEVRGINFPMRRVACGAGLKR